MSLAKLKASETAEKSNKSESDDSLPLTRGKEKGEETPMEQQSRKRMRISKAGKMQDEDTSRLSKRSLNSKSEKTAVVEKESSLTPSTSSSRHSGSNSCKNDESIEIANETPKTVEVKAKPGSAIKSRRKKSKDSKIDKISSPSGPRSSTKSTAEKLRKIAQEHIEETQLQATVAEKTPFVAQTKQKRLKRTRKPVNRQQKRVVQTQNPEWWTNYVPSTKPIFSKSDYPVESFGLHINNVMDKLLLVTCGDGIKHNTNKFTQRDKNKTTVSQSRLKKRIAKKAEEERREKITRMTCNSLKEEATFQFLWDYVGTRAIDLDQECLPIDTEALSDVIFVLVPSILQYGNCTYKSKAHNEIYSMFSWLKMMGSKESYIVQLNRENEQMNCEEHRTEASQLTELFVNLISNNIAKLVIEASSDKRIILVGWHFSTYFNHLIVQHTVGLSAIIDLAFPLKTDLGYRGEPGDQILLTYCPTLFVIGSNTENFNTIALKKMITNMKSESGALIIHHGDGNLNMPTEILNQYGITMLTVYRGILKHIVEFLNLSSTKVKQSQLAPINDVYNGEIDALKIPTATEIQPKRNGRQRSTVNGRPAARRQRKRRIELPAPQSPTSQQAQMLSFTAETPIMTLRDQFE